jgi:hypothetical protein
MRKALFFTPPSAKPFGQDKRIGIFNHKPHEPNEQIREHGNGQGNSVYFQNLRDLPVKKVNAFAPGQGNVI